MPNASARRRWIIFSDVQKHFGKYEYDAEALAFWIADRPERLNGSALKWLRGALKLSPDQLGEKIGVSGADILSWEWETRELIPEAFDLAVRRLYNPGFA